MRQWKAICGILVVFVLGLLADALLAPRIFPHRPGLFYRGGGGPRAAEEAIVRRWSRDLDLDDGQRTQLRAIVRETREEIAPLRRSIRPGIEAILDRAHAKVRAILRPDQQRAFDDLLAKRKARMERGDGRTGSLPPAR